MSINVFVPSFRTDEILDEIRVCLEKGWTGLGFKTVEFEEKWKEYTGLDNAHFLASNTVGLHLAVNILKKEYQWQDGDEIITTPLTFVSTNHVILYEKLQPVFADVDNYLCLDPESVRNKITKKTRAIMYVGMGGNTGQLEEISTICKKYNLPLILDAAHMAGSRYNNKHVGDQVDVSVFSFQAVKNLPTADSGMICFKDPLLDSKARKLSWLGISKDTYERFNVKEKSYKWKYDVPEIGFKYHGNSIQAAIGLIQLKYLDEDNAIRNQFAEQYDDQIEGMPEVEIIRTAPGCYNSRHLYQIATSNRDEILDHFYEHNIFPGVHYMDNTEYPMYSFANGICRQARNYSDRLISLPLHLNLSAEDLIRVVEVLKTGIKKSD